MATRLLGQTSTFGGVFFVSKSLLRIERQRKLKKFEILTQKPRIDIRILIYRTWPILQGCRNLLNLFINFRGLFLCLSAAFRSGSVSTRNGQSRNICGQNEPFAILTQGGYAQVRLYVYHYHHYYHTTLKALYFVKNNTGIDGKLTVRLII